MHERKRSREVERESSHINDDFASAGPWEVLVLVIITCFYSYLFLAVAKLSAQIYGEVATHVYRPIIPILFFGLIFAINPARRESSIPVVLLGVVSIVYAALLKYSQVYFAYDVALIRKILNIAESTTQQLSNKGYQNAAAYLQNLAVWEPVIASSILDVLFMGPLTLVLVSMIRQRSRKTQLPAALPLGTLFVVATIASTLLQRYVRIEASDIFQVIPLLALLGLVSSRTYRAFFASLFCCCVISWLLQSTMTLSCSKLPQILQCTTEVGGFSVLASSESITGRISVLENDKYRLLKADHSLLGGEWIGTGRGQSIFTAFYMQSLGVYAFSPPRDTIKVLQIGLGIGTATKTMLSSPFAMALPNGLSIDVVELDQRVLDYALKYFDLPSPEVESRLTLHAMDAMSFVANANDTTYDFISHDIFSGGSLAYPLFTVQFFSLLKKKLTPGGILTVNFVYAPEMAQINLDAVSSTLQAVFKHVEAYIESGAVVQINNMVFLCSDAMLELYIPESIRALQGSLLGETARNMESWKYTGLSQVSNGTLVLQDEKIDFGASRAMIRDGERQMAFAHWKLMRDLLPAPENEIWTSF